MYLKQFFFEGLGHASYLIGSDSSHEAAVIDPRRDFDIYIEDARKAGLRIRYVLETHNHNDFVSGAQQLASIAGAEHVASSFAELKFSYRGVGEGDQLRLGELVVSVMFTPGHTPEHVTYAVTDTSRADVPVLAFTGGDLLVGSVGRPDLLGRKLGEELAPKLYHSLRDKIMVLEDYVEVLPTHGSGSLCGKNIGGKRTSTIGYERRFNPALQYDNEDEFVRYVLSGNPAIPAYYPRMRPLNQRGPAAWTLPNPIPLPPAEVVHLAGHGATVLDTRVNTAFGGGHIPGALNVGIRGSFATWTGWLLPEDTLIVLVLENDALWSEAVAQLARVGFERVAGYLGGGMEAWLEAALPVRQVEQWTVRELSQKLPLADTQLVDVRTPQEWSEGHIEGAIHIVLGELRGRLDELDLNRTTAVICGSGFRSSAGTSILKAGGFGCVANVLGGMTAWRSAELPVTR